MSQQHASLGPRCPACASPVTATDRFCCNCGGPLPSTLPMALPAPLPPPLPAAPPARRPGPLPPVLVAYDGGPPHTAGPTTMPPAPAATTTDLPDTRTAVEIARAGRRIPRRRRRLLVAVTGLVGLLIAALLLIVPAGAPGSPQQPIQAMFTALSQRRGDTLNDLVHCAPNPLCTPAGLTDGYQPPTDIQIGDATTDTTAIAASGQAQRAGDDHKVVSVRYRLGGTDHQERVAVTRYRQGLFAHTWSIAEPPGQWLQLHSPQLNQVRIGGATFDLTTAANPGAIAPPTADDPSRLWAPPGIYTAAALPNPLYDATTITVTVAEHTDQPVTVTLPAAVKPAVTAEIDRQIHTFLDQCAAQPDLQPTLDTTLGSTHHRCPFEHSAAYTFTEQVRWRIDSYPVIALDAGDDGTLDVRTVTQGRATVSFSGSNDVLEPRRWTPITAAEAIAATGHVVLNATTPTWVD